MSRHPLSLTPLQGIKDADVRAAFQSIVDHFGANDFVTEDDILGTKAGSSLARANRGGLVAIDNSQTNSVWNRAPRPGEVSGIIGQLENQIRESALFRKLGERIDLIDKPGSGIVFRLGQAEGSIVAGQTALSGVEVAIAAERDARITADSAILTTTNTQYAQVNQQVALVQSQVTTVSNNFTALSQTTTTLQSTVGQISNDINNPSTGIKVALQQEALTRATADGKLYSQWTVRIDLNGRVAGFGIDATGTRTSMDAMAIFRVDTFAIAGTQAADSANTKPIKGANETEAAYQARVNAWGDALAAKARADINSALSRPEDETGTIAVPFIVKTQYWTDEGGQVQPPGVYMRKAMIQKLVVDQAYIRDAAVSTLKIGDEAVVIPRSATRGNWINIGNAWSGVLSCGVDFSEIAPNRVLVTGVVSFYALTNGDISSLRVRVLRNGIEIDGQGVSAPGGFSEQVVIATHDDPGLGFHTYTVDAWAEPVGSNGVTSYAVGRRTLTVMGVLR